MYRVTMSWDDLINYVDEDLKHLYSSNCGYITGCKYISVRNEGNTVILAYEKDSPLKVEKYYCKNEQDAKELVMYIKSKIKY